MFALTQRALRYLIAPIAIAASTAAQAAWPERPVTLIVPWGAGGGTDATARIIGSLLERDLKQPINVVNRTGGNGVVGHSAIATAPPDGYTIGLATVEIAMMHWQGLNIRGRWCAAARWAPSSASSPGREPTWRRGSRMR